MQTTIFLKLMLKMCNLDLTKNGHILENRSPRNILFLEIP
jgi:hypothetical protein